MKLWTISVAMGALLSSSLANAVDSSDLAGFTKTASTYVDGEFEGADFDKVVQLDNGMIFQFQTYYYTYAYRPPVDVFRRTFSIADLKKLKVKNPTTAVTLYRLLIGDYVYSVTRIK